MDQLSSAPSTILIVAWLLAMVTYHYVYRKAKTSFVKINNFNKVETTAVTDCAKKLAPGPRPLPILGNLLQLAKYEANPFEGFTELSKTYGSVYSLKMGSTDAVVVSSHEGMKEVLIKKGPQFDGRPDIHRWNLYFDGDRQQSLALCDWSDLQKTRRSVIRSFLLMKNHSANHDLLDNALTTEMVDLMTELDKTVGEPIKAKTPINMCAMNVFMQYMCDAHFDYTDPQFQEVTKNFDIIFEDINNGHATDFLPWLSPFFKKELNSVKNKAHDIRQFLLEKIVEKNYDADSVDATRNVLEGLLANHMKSSDDKVKMDWSTLLFALEDLLGGSSAIGNVMIRVLTFVAQHPEVQEKLQMECDKIIGEGITVSVDHRRDMPYMEATIMEVLRHTASPIVPHVATEDTSINDFDVKKGTVVFLNNYATNMSENDWEDPKSFKPERFINKEGAYQKPSHFLPFSTGKRACVGSNILKHVTFVTLANLMQKYTVDIPNVEEINIPVGRLAVVGDGFNMRFNHRSRG